MFVKSCIASLSKLEHIIMQRGEAARLRFHWCSMLRMQADWAVRLFPAIRTKRR